MDKMFLVYCIYRSGKELEPAIISLGSELLQAVDTAKKAEEFGYDFSHPQTLYVAVAEVKLNFVYKKEDFKSSERTENFPIVFVRFYDEGLVKNTWYNEKYAKTYQVQKGVFENKHGEMKTGTHVSFIVENQSDWGGDNDGILVIEKGEFKVKTQISGTLTIDKGYDVYGNTIKPVSIT